MTEPEATAEPAITAGTPIPNASGVVHGVATANATAVESVPIGNTLPAHPGAESTIEQDLEALIAKVEAKDRKLHCEHNERILRRLRRCLEIQRERIADRTARGVLGTDRP